MANVVLDALVIVRCDVMYDVHRKLRSLSPSVRAEPKPLHSLNLSQSLLHQTALFCVVEMVRSPIAGGSLDITCRVVLEF